MKGGGCETKRPLPRLSLHLNFWCFVNKFPPIIHCSIPSPFFLRLPAPLELCISESRCTVNSYVLVSYGYDLRWRAGVPFPFSALRAAHQQSHNVQCVHKTQPQKHATQRRHCTGLGFSTCITSSIMDHNCDLGLEWKHTSGDESHVSHAIIYLKKRKKLPENECPHCK